MDFWPHTPKTLMVFHRPFVPAADNCTEKDFQQLPFGVVVPSASEHVLSGTTSEAICLHSRGLCTSHPASSELLRSRLVGGL